MQAIKLKLNYNTKTTCRFEIKACLEQRTILQTPARACEQVVKTAQHREPWMTQRFYLPPIDYRIHRKLLPLLHNLRRQLRTCSTSKDWFTCKEAKALIRIENIQKKIAVLTCVFKNML